MSPEYRIWLFPLLGIALAFTGCDAGPDSSSRANNAGHSAPTASTAKANQKILDQRPFNNRDDFENARRGLIAQDPELRIDHPDGGQVWNLPDYAFIDSEGENAPRCKACQGYPLYP